MKVVRVNVRCVKYEHMNLRSRHLDLLSGGQIVAQSSSLSWRRPPLCITCEQSKQRLIPSCMPAIESKSTTRVRAARTRTVLSARRFPMLRPRTKPPIDWVRFFFDTHVDAVVEAVVNVNVNVNVPKWNKSDAREFRWRFLWKRIVAATYNCQSFDDCVVAFLD